MNPFVSSHVKERKQFWCYAAAVAWQGTAVLMLPAEMMFGLLFSCESEASETGGRDKRLPIIVRRLRDAPGSNSKL